MTMYEDENFNGRIPALAPGDMLLNCNLAQQQPHTPMFAGVAGLVFVGCNLTNADVPADAEIIDCNTAQIRIVTRPDGLQDIEAVQ